MPMKGSGNRRFRKVRILSPQCTDNYKKDFLSVPNDEVRLIYQSFEPFGCGPKSPPSKVDVQSLPHARKCQ